MFLFKEKQIRKETSLISMLNNISYSKEHELFKIKENIVSLALSSG